MSSVKSSFAFLASVIRCPWCWQSHWTARI